MKKLSDVIKRLEIMLVSMDSLHRDGVLMTRTDIVEMLKLLKAQEARRRLEVHNIGNVDIPEGVSWEQFQAVMNNVVDALEHADRGESWPYEEAKA